MPERLRSLGHLAWWFLGNMKQSLHCRVCKGALFEEALLQYANMPSSAQGFPTQDTLAKDRGEKIEILQCSCCGLIQLNSKPVSYYRDVIRASAFSCEMKTFRVDQFSHWVEQYKLAGCRLLEIGCGKGEYLSLLKNAGFDAYGIEYSPVSVKACRKQGLNAMTGYLGDDNSRLGVPFDAFVCLNFMEHWPDPNASLQQLQDNLSEQAIGFIEVPNVDMIIEKGLFSEFIADHLLYFTEDTLRFTLQKNGFEVLDCHSVWHNYILSAVVRKRSAVDLGFFKQYRSAITSQLHEFIDQFPVGKVVIWGAGHQALAVISLADIALKIACVIDSAPFKQGKYTPATHLLIRSPDALDERSVNAVIVMAASYSDEVAKMIKNKYGNKIKIAVLRAYGVEVLN